MRVVGGRLIVGKPFRLRCHSERGSLPITYTLHGPNRQPEVRVVSRPGDEAIFNTSAIQKSSDIQTFLCHAKNNDFNPPTISSGHQLQHTTDIIGEMMITQSTKLIGDRIGFYRGMLTSRNSFCENRNIISVLDL